MTKHSKQKPTNIYESFADVSLLMLATFIFLLVTILITSRMAQEFQLPELKKELSTLKEKLKFADLDKQRLVRELGDMVGMATERQIEHVLETAGLNAGKGKKDFDLFIKGLNEIPGKDIHLVVDATGSMHGVSNFLIPILRVIVIRSGKHLDAVTWFSGTNVKTITGSMGEIFDQLMKGAPFIGSNETIGEAFRYAAKNTTVPGAYLLIGDEPSDDRVYYRTIPAPVFTIPLGRSNPTTEWEYQTLSDKTGGKLLHLVFD